jgi:Flp pilus assembly protein TadG
MSSIDAKPRHETGSATVEAVVLVPVLMLFVLLAIAFGRYQSAREEVIGAARAGAEAAAIMPSAQSAKTAANEAALPALSGMTSPCHRVVVATDTSDFMPGGEVTVTVSCTVELSDIGAPGLPGQSTVTISQAAPIDPYRAVS